MKPIIKTSALFRLLRQGLLSACLPMLASAAHAGTASTPSLDAVYGAPVFGTTPVAIHWLEGINLIQPALNTVTSFDSLFELALLSPDNSPVIGAFFVDRVGWCNGASGNNFAGCSVLNSNSFAVDSKFAAGSSGYLDIAHELGHTLGLVHVATDNLMNPILGSALLTPEQAVAVLANPRVQTASDGSRFIEIRPISVLSAVPEPETYAMLLAGIGVIATIAGRRKKLGA